MSGDLHIQHAKKRNVTLRKRVVFKANAKLELHSRHTSWVGVSSKARLVQLLPSSKQYICWRSQHHGGLCGLLWWTAMMIFFLRHRTLFICAKNQAINYGTVWGGTVSILPIHLMFNYYRLSFRSKFCFVCLTFLPPKKRHTVVCWFPIFGHWPIIVLAPFPHIFDPLNMLQNSPNLAKKCD